MMPSAHVILWLMGTVLVLWAATLVARGLPRELLAPRSRRGRCGDARGGDWRLVAGGVVACLTGGIAMVLGYTAFAWVMWPDADPTLPLWGSMALGATAFWSVMAVWALRARVPQAPECPRCRYDMRGISGACPECGFVPAGEGDLFRPRRRKRVAAWALVMACASPLLLVPPKVQRDGVVGLVPTTVMIAGIGWLPERMIVSPGRDAALDTRYFDERMWGWQRRWLERRAAVLATTSPASVRQIRRAVSFMPRPLVGNEQEALVRRLAELVVADEQNVHALEAPVPWLSIPLTVWWNKEGAHAVDEYAEGLLARLASEDAQVSAAAAGFLLWSPAYAGTALERIVQNHMAGKGGQRYVFRVVGDSPAAWPHLERMLRQGDDELRIELLRSVRFGRWAWPRAEDLIVEMVSDDDAQVAQQAAMILYGYDSSAPLAPVLKRAAAEGGVDAWGEWLLRAGAMLEARSCELAALLEEEDPAVREVVLRLLEVLMAESRNIHAAADALRALLNDDDADVRARAAKLLDFIAGPR